MKLPRLTLTFANLCILSHPRTVTSNTYSSDADIVCHFHNIPAIYTKFDVTCTEPLKGTKTTLIQCIWGSEDTPNCRSEICTHWLSTSMLKINTSLEQVKQSICHLVSTDNIQIHQCTVNKQGGGSADMAELWNTLSLTLTVSAIALILVIIAGSFFFIRTMQRLKTKYSKRFIDGVEGKPLTEA